MENKFENISNNTSKKIRLKYSADNEYSTTTLNEAFLEALEFSSVCSYEIDSFHTDLLEIIDKHIDLVNKTNFLNAFKDSYKLEVIKNLGCEVDENVWLNKVIPVTTSTVEYPLVADAYFIKRLVARIHPNEDDIEDGDILDRIDENETYNFHLYEVNIDDIDYMSYVTDEEVIEEYMEESIETIPPIILGLPIDYNSMQLEYFPLIDGAHRCHTLKNKGLSKIVAYIPTPKV